MELSLRGVFANEFGREEIPRISLPLVFLQL